MASHRTVAAHAAVAATHPSTTGPAPAVPSSTAAGQTSLKCAALYARVSTEKQERDDTVASQVDLLCKAAAAAGYDLAPTNVFIDEGASVVVDSIGPRSTGCEISQQKALLRRSS
jgi:Resolvase, N terminal domain